VKETNRRVGIVCLHATPFFDAAADGPVGGMETRASIFARGLAKAGWSVNLYVARKLREKDLVVDGVCLRSYRTFLQRLESWVAPRFAKRWWFPVLDLKVWELTLVVTIPLYFASKLLPSRWSNRFVGANRPDVVICFGVSDISASVARQCQEIGKPFVLMLASDSDLSADYTEYAKGQNDYGAKKTNCWYVIAHASLIVVQTDYQKELLAQRFGRDGVIIRNPAPRPPMVEASKKVDRDIILWIGRAENVCKRPMLCLEVARQVPEANFLLVANPSDPVVWSALVAQRPGNVTLLASVAPDAIWAYFQRAKIFINTSRYEGLPNVFLQAGMTDTPVISFEVDPDGMFMRHGAGICTGGDFDLFVQEVKDIWHNSKRASLLGHKLRKHVESSHDPEHHVAALDAQLRRTINGKFS